METTTGNYVQFWKLACAPTAGAGACSLLLTPSTKLIVTGKRRAALLLLGDMHLGPTRGCALPCAACGAHRGAGPAATPALAAEARNPRDAGQRWPATRYVRPSESGCRFSLAASVRMGTPARTRLRPSLRAPGCRSYMTRSMMFRQASQGGFSTRGDGGGHELSRLGSGGCDRCW